MKPQFPKRSLPAEKIALFNDFVCRRNVIQMNEDALLPGMESAKRIKSFPAKKLTFVSGVKRTLLKRGSLILTTGPEVIKLFEAVNYMLVKKLQ